MVIDGRNSCCHDDPRSTDALRLARLQHYVGVGVSGGVRGLAEALGMPHRLRRNPRLDDIRRDLLDRGTPARPIAEWIQSFTAVIVR